MIQNIDSVDAELKSSSDTVPPTVALLVCADAGRDHQNRNKKDNQQSVHPTSILPFWRRHEFVEGHDGRRRKHLRVVM